MLEQETCVCGKHFMQTTTTTSVQYCGNTACEHYVFPNIVELYEHLQNNAAGNQLITNLSLQDVYAFMWGVFGECSSDYGLGVFDRAATIIAASVGN